MSNLNLTENEELFLQEVIPHILNDYSEDDLFSSVFNNLEEVKAFMQKVKDLEDKPQIQIKKYIPINPNIYHGFKKQLEKMGVTRETATNEQIELARDLAWDKDKEKDQEWKEYQTTLDLEQELTFNQAQEWLKKLTIYLTKLIADEDNIEIKFSERMSNTFAYCIKSKKSITYSLKFIIANLNNRIALKYLAIHEVCHLIYDNHNYDFEKLCARYGLYASGGHITKAKDIKVNPVENDWVAYCPNCNKKFSHRSKPKVNKSCGNCSNGYNPKYRLVFHNISKQKNDKIKMIMNQIKNKNTEEIKNLELK